MQRQIDGSWRGWSGDTIVQLTDGTMWRQDEYRYAYRPQVTITSGKMLVAGMSQAVRVSQLR